MANKISPDLFKLKPTPEISPNKPLSQPSMSIYPTTNYYPLQSHPINPQQEAQPS